MKRKELSKTFMMISKKKPFGLYGLYKKCQRFNPLSPHNALKHHFTSLKTDLILLQQRVLE